MHEFTDMGTTSWQTIAHQWHCFERDGWIAWTPHRREVARAQVSRDE